MAARKYEPRLRAEAAADTRRRILDAMCERLHEAPSEPVSVDRIARMAGVSRSTVYLIFGSRAGLFYALGTDLLQRGGFERITSAAARPDARTGLREGIRAGVLMYAANRDVLRALHSMAQLDAGAVGGAVHRMEEGRAAGVASLAWRLARQESLRRGVTVDEATEVLWVLTSFDSFDALRTGRRMPAEDVARALVKTAELALLEDAPGVRPVHRTPADADRGESGSGTTARHTGDR
jgi:AcrR family transcriptional regulator